MDVSQLGKWLVLAGVGLAGAGVLVWVLGKTGIPFGRLPGDVHAGGDKVSFHFPVVTCIILSIVLTLLINLFIRLFRR